jgi:hypothetical protein
MQWGPGDGSQGGQGGFGGQPPQQPQAPQQAWSPPPAMPPQQQQPQGGSGSSGGFQMPPGVHVPSAAEAKGFFASLFDLTFSSFIIPTLLKVMYVITLIGLMLGFLGFEFMCFTEQVIAEYGNTTQGLLAMALAPIGLFVWILMVRMIFEWAFVGYRFAQALPEISRKMKD